MDRGLRMKTRYKCILGDTEGDGSRGELLFFEEHRNRFWKFGESSWKNDNERMRICKFYYSIEFANPKSRENIV